MTLNFPELAEICRGFGLLLRSGIGGGEAACLLARENRKLEELLCGIGNQLDDGASLADALEDCGVFPEHLWNMVRIGEEAGRLEETLMGLADYYEEHSRTRAQIRSEVAGPAMVLGLVLVVLGVLLVKVLPVFDRVYASLGSCLTGPAACLLYLGELLEEALPAMVAVLILVAMAAGVLWLRPNLGQKIAGFWKKRFGDRWIGRKFNNARFARALALGFSSGMTLERSLELAEKLLEDVPGAAQRCGICIRAVEDGASLADALEAGALLPPAQGRLLEVGFRSGNGDLVMEHIADTMMEDAWNSFHRAISGIEPAMVLVSSLLVGLILLSVMLPLADILSVLG